MDDERELPNCIERQLLEVEALEAIYDGTDAFVVEDESWWKRAQFLLETESAVIQELESLQFSVALETGARVRFTLPIAYPLSKPAHLAVEDSSLVRKDLDLLNEKLKTKSATLVGEESALELVQEAEELLQTLHEERSTSIFNANDDSCKIQVHTLLLRIDHMNDSTTYMKKLEGWVNDLELSGKIFFKMRETPCIASSGGSKVTPKGRAENIVLLLEGGNIAAFTKLLRTARLTSQDRREKKSTVVWETHSPSMTSVVGSGALEKIEYKTWSELSDLWESLGLQEKGGPSFQECFRLKPQQGQGSSTEEGASSAE
jgi:hypothetical protein